MGWDPLEAELWTSDEGDVYALDSSCHLQTLRDIITEAVQRRDWDRAALHHLGTRHQSSVFRHHLEALSPDQSTGSPQGQSHAACHERGLVAGGPTCGDI